MRRQVLYLTNTQLTYSMWQSGHLSSEQRFDNDEAGWQALSTRLALNKHVSTLLLIDLIEEDFQRETIPHVVGKTRATLIERRLQNLYRDTPFRNGARQGREKEGRKDDRMLFSAVTNAPLLKPWIDAILKEKVPLAGIYSVALLSTVMFAKLHAGNGPVLLITHQSGGLRQTYFHDGYLRFSRLTQLPSQEPEVVADVANVEMAKTRQFLANTRMLQRGEQIEIVVMDNTETLQKLQALSPDSAAANYRFIDLQEAISILGLRISADIPVCDSLFLSLLAAKPSASHYALFEQKRIYALWQVRIILYLLSGATVAASLFITGTNTMEAIDAAGQNRELEQDARVHQQRFEEVNNSMPATATNPHDMKLAVNLEQMIALNKPAPNTMFVKISRVLNTLPQLNLTELNWEVSDKNEAGDAAVSEQARAAAAAAPPSPALIGVPKPPFEIMIIKGQVLPFKDDYRSALEYVHQFSDEMMKDKHVEVTVTHAPLDIRTSATLAGQAGDPVATPTADFELRLVWKP